MSKEKEFERNRCFMFFESYLESAEKYEALFGTEVAFKYLCGIARYALYQEESDEPITNGLVSALKNTIDAGQDKREKGFNGENFEQTKMVAEYYRDHPNASQRAIVDALGGAVKKTKVQKTLAKIKESGLSIDEYIENVINPNLTNNGNNNSTSNSNNNSKTTTTTSRESSSTELANAQTTASTMPSEEEKKESRTEGKRLLKDLSDEELTSLLEDFRREVKYKELQVKYNLANTETNSDLGKRIETIQDERRQEIEELKTVARFDRLKTELFKYPDKKAKLMQFTECTSDSMLLQCLKDIDRDIDDVLAFYEDNIDTTNDHNEPSFARWTWKSRMSGKFSTYEVYIQEVMDSNGYSKAS